MGKTKKKEPGNALQINQPVTVKRLQALLKKGDADHVIVIELMFLGDDEKSISKTLLYLAEHSNSVKVKNPRFSITANGQVPRLLRSIIQSAKESSMQKRNLSRLIGNLQYGVPTGRPPKKISADIFQRVVALHQENRSIRAISRELGDVSRNAVAKIIQLHAERKQLLENSKP